MSIPAMQQPAGLSSDTLEPPTPPHALQDDQWSDTHDTAETDDERDAIEEVAERQDDLTIRPSKMPTNKTHDVNPSSQTLPDPPHAEELPHEEAETGSVHSLPVVQVTEPTSPAVPTPRSVSSTYPASSTSLTPAAASSLDRRARTRAQMDVSLSISVFSM